MESRKEKKSEAQGSLTNNTSWQKKKQEEKNLKKYLKNNPRTEGYDSADWKVLLKAKNKD